METNSAERLVAQKAVEKAAGRVAKTADSLVVPKVGHWAYE